jgi:hypothetical protein
VENLSNKVYICGMEHIVCKKCKSEFDLASFAVRGGFVPHDTCCEVCRSVLRGWEKGQETIAVITKRGLAEKAA